MKHAKGFSLIELLIVVAIIGMLTMIAIGFFGQNVISSNRSEGRSVLTEVAGSLEKCKSLYGSYNAANCNVVLPQVSDTNYYSVAATAMTATTFTLTATPVIGEPQENDTDCTSMTLTNTGVRGGTGGDPTECW